MKKLLLLVLVFMLSLVPLFAVDENVKKAVEEKIGDGRINWEKGLVIAVGYGAYDLKDKHVGRGRLMALRAAEVNAKRNLLETIQGVRIDSETIVENFQTKSDIIRSSMSGFIRGAKRYGEERYNSDGTVEVDVSVPLFGADGLIHIIAPEMGFGDVAIIDIENPVYTGLVVVINDEKAMPMMAPKVISEAGTVIYAASKVNKDFAIKMGIVGYATDLDKVKTNDRVTDNPLIITAVKIDGDKIIISNIDADKILKVKEKLTFIQQCRVMFVLTK